MPVLPFALSYALYTPRPELYAMSALVVLGGIALTRLQSDRAVLMASIVYGVTIAVLALVHEGIPLEVALGGGALAISILPAHLAPGRRRLCAVAALGPGLAAIATIAAFSRNDVGTRLCEQIPHRQLDEPFPSDPMAYLAGRTPPTKTDFHSWVCNFERTIVDARVTDGLHKVGTFGAGPLLASFAVGGVLYFVVSLWATKSFSGLRVSALLHEVRGGKLTAPLLGARRDGAVVHDCRRLDALVGSDHLQRRPDLRSVHHLQARDRSADHPATPADLPVRDRGVRRDPPHRRGTAHRRPELLTRANLKGRELGRRRRLA